MDNAVVEVIIKLVSNPKFAAMMQEKINSKVDTTAIEQEIAAAEKHLRQYYSVKSKIMEEIDTLDPDDCHYIIRKSDLDERLYRMYDKIEEAENNLMDARAKKQAIPAHAGVVHSVYHAFSYRKDIEKQKCPRRACCGSPGASYMRCVLAHTTSEASTRKIFPACPVLALFSGPVPCYNTTFFAQAV